jgi:BirA family biotin operon repressor/biotin-[acetyl-CoA-carboxylase] ligase
MAQTVTSASSALIKGHILTMLRREGRPVSGDRLARGLGVSRVAVWKHVRRLRELGYGIDTSAAGYRLVTAPDTPYPWEFPGREDRIHFFAEADSTMNAARDLARQGAPAGTLVVADRQTHGRGRLKRRWLSPEGGLYMTMILRPTMVPSEIPRLSLAVAVDWAKTLRRSFGIDAVVKWPNDVLCNGRKLIGILSEMETEGDLAAYVNVGVGINVNTAPQQLLPNAGSLKWLLNKPVRRTALLAAFLDRFERRLRGSWSDAIIDEWRRCTETIGRVVRVETIREHIEGTAVDIDANGGLVVRRSDGTTQTLLHGDCFYTSYGGALKCLADETLPRVQNPR